MERRVAQISLFDGGLLVTGWRIECKRGWGERWHAETDDVYESESDAIKALKRLNRKKARK